METEKVATDIIGEVQVKDDIPLENWTNIIIYRKFQTILRQTWNLEGCRHTFLTRSIAVEDDKNNNNKEFYRPKMPICLKTMTIMLEIEQLDLLLHPH